VPIRYLFRLLLVLTIRLDNPATSQAVSNSHGVINVQVQVNKKIHSTPAESTACPILVPIESSYMRLRTVLQLTHI